MPPQLQMNKDLYILHTDAESHSYSIHNRLCQPHGLQHCAK